MTGGDKGSERWSNRTRLGRAVAKGMAGRRFLRFFHFGTRTTCPRVSGYLTKRFIVRNWIPALNTRAKRDGGRACMLLRFVCTRFYERPPLLPPFSRDSVSSSVIFSRAAREPFTTHETLSGGISRPSLALVPTCNVMLSRDDNSSTLGNIWGTIFIRRIIVELVIS